MARGSVKRIVSETTGGVTWQARWSYVDDEGNRRHRMANRDTKREAEDVLTKALHELRTGAYLEPSDRPMGEFVAEWFATMRHTWPRETTYYHRSQAWKRYGEPELAKVALRNVTLARVQKIYDAMSDRGLGSNSIKAIHVVLTMALDAAVTRGLLARNVARDATVPASRKTKPEFWPVKDALRFLQEIAKDKDAPLWTVMLRTGMRIGEALALRWSEVDLVGGTVRIERTVSKNDDGHEIIVDGTKTDSSTRTVVLVPACVAILKRHRVEQNTHRLSLGDRWEDLDLVFPGPEGRPYGTGAKREQFGRRCRRFGLPTLSPHGLRHTAATLALASGVHPIYVKEMLGHSSITITLDLYSHTTPDLSRAAAERIDDFLREQGDGSDATTSKAE